MVVSLAYKRIPRVGLQDNEAPHVIVQMLSTISTQAAVHGKPLAPPFEDLCNERVVASESPRHNVPVHDAVTNHPLLEPKGAHEATWTTLMGSALRQKRAWLGSHEVKGGDGGL